MPQKDFWTYCAVCNGYLYLWLPYNKLNCSYDFSTYPIVFCNLKKDKVDPAFSKMISCSSTVSCLIETTLFPNEVSKICWLVSLKWMSNTITQDSVTITMFNATWVVICISLHMQYFHFSCIVFIHFSHFVGRAAKLDTLLQLTDNYQNLLVFLLLLSSFKSAMNLLLLFNR